VNSPARHGRVNGRDFTSRRCIIKWKKKKEERNLLFLKHAFIGKINKRKTKKKAE
jgi:hypothetical protein